MSQKAFSLVAGLLSPGRSRAPLAAPPEMERDSQWLDRPDVGECNRTRRRRFPGFRGIQTTALAVSASQGNGLLAVDNAVLHYEGNFLQGGDVVQGIAGDGDYIGGVAGLKEADFVLPAQ
jgi:hypothetical protein